jgi:hypothetical protein
MELSSAAMEAQGLPEASVATFAFLLNFPWEAWHIQLYRSLETQSYRETVTNVTVASVGDAVLPVIAFWVVAAAIRSRVWILYPDSETDRWVRGCWAGDHDRLGVGGDRGAGLVAVR